jgi:hypothetical protein
VRREQMVESVAMEPEAMDNPTGGTCRRKKVRWADLSPQVRVVIVLGGIAELVMTTIALADLARRPSRQVRGAKPFWVATFTIQPFGPVLYFLLGRRSTTP